MTRTYDMTKRAAAASRTSQRIIDVTQELLTTRPVSDVTLQAIADAAGVTVQTVLRHMGSRDGCFVAVGERLAERNDNQRGRVPAGDVAGAVAGLLDHYETDGRLVLNLLAQEDGGSELARRAAREGRAYHRMWVEQHFPTLTSGAPRSDIDALVAATDLYVWKLLRLDLGRSRRDTETVMVRTVRALLAAPPEENE